MLNQVVSTCCRTCLTSLPSGETGTRSLETSSYRLASWRQGSVFQRWLCITQWMASFLPLAAVIVRLPHLAPLDGRCLLDSNWKSRRMIHPELRVELARSSLVFKGLMVLHDVETLGNYLLNTHGSFSQTRPMNRRFKSRIWHLLYCWSV